MFNSLVFLKLNKLKYSLIIGTCFYIAIYGLLEIDLTFLVIILIIDLLLLYFLKNHEENTNHEKIKIPTLKPIITVKPLKEPLLKPQIKPVKKPILEEFPINVLNKLPTDHESDIASDSFNDLSLSELSSESSLNELSSELSSNELSSNESSSELSSITTNDSSISSF